MSTNPLAIIASRTLQWAHIRKEGLLEKGKTLDKCFFCFLKKEDTLNESLHIYIQSQ